MWKCDLKTVSIRPYMIWFRWYLDVSVSVDSSYVIWYRLSDAHLYSAILRSLEQTHCSCMWFYMSDFFFFFFFFSFFFLVFFYSVRVCTCSCVRACPCVCVCARVFCCCCCLISAGGVLTALAWLVPHETAAVSAQVLYTLYNHAPCHYMQSHIRKMYACLAVTCHLHFWQNGRDLLRATSVTRSGTNTEIRVSAESRPW